MPKTAITILIIDDTPEDRDTYRELLLVHRDYLFTFLEAEDAESGLELLKSVEVDCILLDFSLPGISGIKFLDAYGKTRRRESLSPVVFITGRGSESVAVEAMKHGATDYLVKSTITTENLYRAVKLALDRSELQQSLTNQELRRTEMEQELRRSEEQFRLLVDSIRDYALIMLDESGKVSSWNSGARQILGYHDTEIMGQHFRAFFTPEDIRHQSPEHELEQARTGGVAQHNRWHIKKNGQRFWASGTVRPVRNSAGELQGYVKILKDETPLKTAQDDSNLHQLRLDAALEASPLPLILFELDTGRLLFANCAMRRLFARGFDPGAATVTEGFAHLSGDSITLAELSSANGELAPPLAKKFSVGNETIHVLVSCGALPVSRGPGTAIAFFQDVTYLHETIRKLENSIQARDEFLSLASHELKTPLTSLRLQLDLFLRTLKTNSPLSADACAAMSDMLVRQVDRLKTLVNDLLDASRMNVGRLTLSRESTDLVEIVKACVAKRQTDLQEANCEVTVESLGPILGDWDRARLFQVVDNLLTNAIKYAPGKPIEIGIRGGESAGVELSVRDHGPGISQDLREVIFERFSRLHGSGRISGLGLGLYITKRIVSAHGGKIDLDHHISEGARFRVFLPVNSSGEDALKN